MVQADLLVLLTDVDGLYTANPSTNPDARWLEKIEKISSELIDMAGGTSNGTGGMLTKIKAATLATMSGVPVYICSSLKTDSLLEAAEETKDGSLFLTHEKGLKTQKQWLAFYAKSQGEIYVDQGAADALRNKGKSLLVSGLVSVSGSFTYQDTVTVYEEGSGAILGKGCVRFGKPVQFADLLTEYQEVLEKRESLLLVSMAAGLTLELLEKLTSSHHRWIRIMPNTPVAVGEGVITYSLSQQANQVEEDLFRELLSSAGLLVKLEEKQLDAATALADCGPAFVYLFIEALADAGVRAGLSRDISLELANQTLLGAAKLSQVSGQHPAQLKDQVCSLGGSTIAGVASLEENAFRGTVMDAVQAAYKRTQELGDNP